MLLYCPAVFKNVHCNYTEDVENGVAWLTGLNIHWTLI